MPQARPRFRVQSIFERFLIETEAGDQDLVELRFDRADRDVLSVGAAIRRVERRAAVEEVAAALVAPFAACERRVDERQQRRGTVDDRGIDDLPAAGALCLEERREDADDQIQRAAAEIAEKVERRDRPAARLADRVQRTGERDVVDVVAGRGRKGPGLTPSRHPPVHEPGIALQDRIGAEAEALHDSGSKSLQQDVRALEQRQRGFAALGALEIDGHDATPALDDIAFVERRRAWAYDTDDVSAHIREQHRRERHRPDAGEFDYSEAGERPALLVAHEVGLS